jgi:hypothetical protein
MVIIISVQEKIFQATIHLQPLFNSTKTMQEDTSKH